MTGFGKPSPRASVTTSSAQPMYSTPNQPFEDVLLRQRTLGQDIIPSPREPKRTESLYTPQKPTPAAAPAAPTSGGGGFFGKSGKLKVCHQIRLQSSSFCFSFLQMTHIEMFFFSLFLFFHFVSNSFRDLTQLTKTNEMQILLIHQYMARRDITLDFSK